MGKVTGIAAILLCATAVLFVRAKHPDAIGKWRVKLGLQTSCPDERKKVAPSKRVRHLQYAAPYDFGEEFLVLDAWHATREEFLDGHIDVWYSSDGEKELSVRKDLVRFFGYEICENVLKFGERGVERVLISVFNKGVAGFLIAESEALSVIGVVSERLIPAKRSESSTSDERGKTIIRSEWSGTQPKVVATIGLTMIDGNRYAEYLNFEMSLGGTAPLESESATVAPGEHVRYAGGDVYIEGIPMVNQGQKGYCVPATISRVLRYFGLDVDMHALALDMETDVGGGTLIGNGFPTLDRVVAETGLDRVDNKKTESYDDEYIGRYNQAARVVGKPELLIDDFTVEEEQDGRPVKLRHYDWLVDAMEDEVKRLSRDYDAVGYARFRAGVTSSVLRGFPLLWSVERLFPWDRKDESPGGGHMRLIVGYNLQTDEILYSDSWGSGHELKRARFAEAWRETDFLSCLQPSER